jgi:hypothetical protein
MPQSVLSQLAQKTQEEEFKKQWTEKYPKYFYPGYKPAIEIMQEELRQSFRIPKLEKTLYQDEITGEYHYGLFDKEGNLVKDLGKAPEKDIKKEFKTKLERMLYQHETGEYHYGLFDEEGNLVKDLGKAPEKDIKKEPKYDERVVPLGNNMAVKQFSIDGGKTWHSFGKPFLTRELKEKPELKIDTKEKEKTEKMIKEKADAYVNYYNTQIEQLIVKELEKKKITERSKNFKTAYLTARDNAIKAIKNSEKFKQYWNSLSDKEKEFHYIAFQKKGYAVAPLKKQPQKDSLEIRDLLLLK